MANDRLSYLQSNEESSNISVGLNPIRNLNEIFSTIDSVDPEHLRVYLRIRPHPDNDEESENKNIEIEDASHIGATAPENSHAFRNRPHGASKFTQRFTFTHVYGPSSSQKELFENTTQRLVKELIDGQNCLLFSYGATNSGKTHTIQGTSSDPGVLPRSLEFLFQSIGNNQYPRSDLRPQQFCGVVRLSEKEVLKEQENKEAIFRLAADPRSLYLSKSNLSLHSRDSDQNSQCSSVNDTKLSDFCPDESIITGISPNSIYAIFVSFAEIYKENIFDLLERPSMQKKGKRSPLNLGEDKNGSIYIKGLREVRATSIEEALQILEAGRQSLHFASTQLNHHSSRSHSIFTVKLIRLAHHDNPHVARVSMLSLCDLAGTERAGKTLNSHDRLKEANNINTSLLVLGRCIDALRQNQIIRKQNCGPKKQLPVPYRDSKVTRIFQSFFMGRGNMVMIVNVGTSSRLFDETLKVLKFSALAQKVVITQEKSHLGSLRESGRNSNFANMMRQSYNMSSNFGRLSVPWANSTLSEVTFGGNGENEMSKMGMLAEEEEEDDRVEELFALIKKLKNKLLQEAKEKQEVEVKLRKELCQEFGKKIVEIEDSWRSRVQEERARHEDYMEWRVNHVMESMKKGPTRKRMRPEDLDQDEECVPSILLVREELKVKDLEGEKNLIQEELDALKNSFKASNQSLKTYQSQASKLTFQLAKLTESYEKLRKEKSELEHSKLKQISPSECMPSEEMQGKIKSLTHIIEVKNNEIKEIQGMLDEAAEEFIDKEQTITSLNSLLFAEKDKTTKQSYSISELESRLSEAEHLVANQGHLLEEREQLIFDMRQELEAKKIQTLEHSQKELDEVKQALEKSERRNKKTESILEEKESIIQELEKECCNLTEKASALEESYNYTNGKLKEMEDSFRKKLEEERDSYEAKSKPSELSFKDATEEKELLLFKIAELELETKSLSTSLKETREKLESAVSDEVLQENNERLEKRLQNLQESLSLKEICESELSQEINQMRQSLDKLVMDKQEMESKLQLVTQSEESLKVILESKENELNRLLSSNENLQSSLEEMSTAMAENIENEKHIVVLKKKLDESDTLIGKMEEIKKELEINLSNALQNEKDSKASSLKMGAKMKALSDVKDDLIEKNRMLENSLDNAESEKNKLKTIIKELEEKSADNEKLIKEKNQCINEHEAFLKEHKLENTKLESQNVDLTTKVEELVKEKKNLSQAIADLEYSSTVKEDQLNADFEKLKREKDTISEENEALAKEIEDLQCENSCIKKRADDLSSSYSESEKGIAQLKVSLQNMEEENRKLESKLSEVNQRFLTSTFQLEEMEKKMLKAEEAFKTEHNKLIKIPELETKLEEKESLVVNLSQKNSSLDKKMTEIEEECSNYKVKCECLEKEVAAVRSARVEEVSLMRSTIGSHEASLSAKEDEILSLQQEIKRLLQCSSISDLSQDSANKDVRIKKEQNDYEKMKNLESKLQERDLERNSLLLKITSLEDQLSFLSINSSQNQTDFHEVREAPVRTQTRGRKKLQVDFDFDPLTPDGDSLALRLEGSDLETPSAVSKAKSTRKATRSKMRGTSEENNFKTPRSRKNTFEWDSTQDEDWEPPTTSARKTRSTRSTKLKSVTKPPNPHLEDKENITRDTTIKGKESAAPKVKPRGRGRRPLFNADSTQTFDAIPNLIDADDPPDSSPHSVVRRQLRSRRK